MCLKISQRVQDRNLPQGHEVGVLSSLDCGFSKPLVLLFVFEFYSAIFFSSQKCGKARSSHLRQCRAEDY